MSTGVAITQHSSICGRLPRASENFGFDRFGVDRIGFDPIGVDRFGV